MLLFITFPALSGMCALYIRFYRAKYEYKIPIETYID